MGIRTMKMEEANGLDESKVDSIHFDRESDRFESVELSMGGELEIGIIDNDEIDEALDDIDAEELAAELDDI
jgi:hypothetical protein